MSWDAKAATPDTTISDSAILIGADSQSASTPSAYPVTAVAQYVGARLGLDEIQYDIGTPGAIGFGVGPYRGPLPSGFAKLAGSDSPGADEYGNYLYQDGSVMVWVPAFWVRVGNAASPRYATYGANAIDILPLWAFADETAANADGYFLPRAFVDGGERRRGFFVDKYQCSNNSGTASSVKNGAPLSSNATHNPFSDLAGLSVADNIYAGAIAAAKTRGPVFFPATRFIHAALAILATAHGQAATGPAACAWYDAAGTTNFPKGCNNNALGDANDNTIVYSSDGYSNCGLTGSGLPFAKTTHNGQGCGIADLNGNMYEVSLGLTCRTTTLSISGASQENPVELTTTAAHGLSTGDVVLITGITGMTEINDRMYTATVVDTTRVTLDGVDGTGFTAYTSGGALARGTFHVLKPTVAMSQVTAGTALATDHWGATGVAAQFDSLEPAFATTWPNNAIAQRFGNGVTGVLGASPLGNASLLASLGLPAAGAMSPSGTNLFGQDYYYHYIRNDLCALSGMAWNSGSAAGVWAVALTNARNVSSFYAGFRAACYL